MYLTECLSPLDLHASTNVSSVLKSGSILIRTHVVHLISLCWYCECGQETVKIQQHGRVECVLNFDLRLIDSLTCRN